MQINEHIPAKFPTHTYVAVDLELADANEKILHRPITGKFACLSICADPDTVYIIRDERYIGDALGSISDCIWVMHNAKFDLTHLRRWGHIYPRLTLWDTMLIEQILWNGYFSNFALDDLARRYLDIELDKSLQKSWNNLNLQDLPRKYLEYSATDAIVTLKVCEQQRKIMKNSYFKIWKEIELPVLWAVLDFKGFCLDVDKWKKLADIHEQHAKEIEAELPFNPRSYKEVRNILSTSGFAGIPSTGESVLETWIAHKPDTEAAKLAEKILLARRFSKYASTYGMSWVQEHVECEDGNNMVYGDYHTIGAETGRFSCSSPNMQNVPARDTKEFRECFTAIPGNKLIIADYSQQEIGIAAYISQDKRMKEIFNSGQDIYIAMAKLMYGKDITRDDPLRKRMKSIVLGTNYGMSSYGLARKEHITEEEAEDVLERFAKRFPGLTSWMKCQMGEKIKTRTVSGRVAWLNPYSSQRERNALNNPIQGTASDMMKMSLIELHKQWYFPFPFSVVAAIHDEIVLDVPEKFAGQVAKFTSNIMAQVANKIMPEMNFRAEACIGNSWADKE